MTEDGGEMMSSQHGHIIVVGNEKGGSGKSTTAMHLIVALLGSGRSVASIDLDVRQRSLTRYLDNRKAQAEASSRRLAMPEHVDIDGCGEAAAEALTAALRRLTAVHDVIIVDTPGNDSALNRVGHALADTLITPINDSFIDLDVLARVDAGRDVDGELDEATLRVVAPSQYSEMVWEARKRRAAARGTPVDWIVMRNRLSSLDARNKRRMERVLAEMAERFGFRQVAGFGERVIYRELFPLGLTLMDLGSAAGGEPLSLSHVAARQEVRALVSALDLPALPRMAAAG